MTTLKPLLIARIPYLASQVVINVSPMCIMYFVEPVSFKMSVKGDINAMQLKILEQR